MVNTEALEDAIDNADCAKEAMLRAWFEHANSGGFVARSRVKINYPVTAS